MLSPSKVHFLKKLFKGIILLKGKTAIDFHRTCSEVLNQGKQLWNMSKTHHTIFSCLHWKISSKLTASPACPNNPFHVGFMQWLSSLSPSSEMHYTGCTFADVHLLPVWSLCLHPLAMGCLCQTWKRLLWKSRHLHQDLVFFCLWFYCCAWKSALIFWCFSVCHTMPLSPGSRGTLDPPACWSWV